MNFNILKFNNCLGSNVLTDQLYLYKEFEFC